MRKPDPFDPLAPVGQTEEAVLPVLNPGAEADGPDDQRIDQFVTRATEPPPDLRLDWGQLRANLSAKAPPVRVRRARRVVFYLAGSLAAAAAILLVATVALRLWPGPGPGTPPSVPPGLFPSGSGLARVGVDLATARRLIDEPSPATGPTSIRVVYPRRTPDAAPRSAGDVQASPLVLTDTAPLTGTPYARQVPDGEVEILFANF